MSNINFLDLEFEGWLSYPTRNKIDFKNSIVTQLIGKNGAGKSTIATVLEETCYNKNSRGIKKEEIFNWSGKKEYSSILRFTKDEDLYIINKNVKSTAKVTLTKNGENIGGHTATQTYKVIEDVLECDFPTFSKLVYQSIKSNLDFLTATDANRKKFLIGLFDQAIYKETEEKIKPVRKDVKSRLDVATGKLSAIKSSIEDSKKIPEYVELQAEISMDVSLHKDLINQNTVKLSLISKQERQLQQKSLLESKITIAAKKLQALDSYSALSSNSERITEITRESNILTAELASIKTRYTKFKSEASASECPTCGTHLDTSAAQTARDIAKAEYTPKFSRNKELIQELSDLKAEQAKHTEYQAVKARYDTAVRDYDTFVKSAELSEVNEDTGKLQSEIATAKTTIAEYEAELQAIRDHNRKAEMSNSRRDMLLSQSEGLSDKLKVISAELEELELELTDLDILLNAFGSKGVVSYKLESCIKSFEDLINKYLSVMTSGKFALGFELDATKLQVVIYNDGYRTSMEGCSSGQQSRISIATLLAIRSLLSAISKVNINLLFLDEVISVIDTDGINTLVELLLTETDLNSIIVSHGYSHPLTAAVEVIQDAEGSKLVVAK